MRGVRPGTILKVMAGLLLFFLSAGSAWAMTATDCATCHGADVVEGHHDTTDANSYFMQGACEQCHVGITTGNDCTTCHEPAGYTFNSHHLPQAGQTTIDCAQCHTGAGNPKDCGSCHKGEIPRDFHHTQLTAYREATTGKLNCTVCHPGSQLTSDCKSCHDEGSTAYQAKHHNYVDPTTNSQPACTSCHTKLQATTGNCQGCHVPRAEMTDHHALTGAPAYMSCGFCHAGLASGPKETRTGCNACHATANLPLHHDKVRSERSLACNQCHKTAVVVAGCESCHINGTTPDTSAIHHDPAPGTPYTSGNCGACHASSGFVRTNCNSIACHPALSPASGARHHQSDIITKYPVFQSSSNPGSADCSICHIFNYVFMNDSQQMSVVPPPAEDCFFCHENTINRGNLQTKHHNTTATTSGDCALCHSGVSTSGGACTTCHSATSSKPATSQTHHAAATANGTPCADCHQGISPSASCADCHTTTGGSDDQRHHLFKNSQNQPYACDTCHTGASNIYQSCKGCHEKVSINGVVTTIESSAWHHMTTAYTTGTCATCHKTVDGSSLQKDCSYCHIGSGKPSIVTQHHSTDSYQTGACGECHAGTEPANIGCAGCHPGTLGKHHTQTVILNNTIQPKPCRDCHSTIQLAGSSCATCHTLPMAEFHHDNSPKGPLTAVGGNCAVCHMSINDPSVCANCHASSPHHATNWSQTGDCAHCHAIPSWAADRPAQAACRECHGTTMHDKGGPIQNYGSCAACHNTIPYHPAPTSIPGYTRYGAGKKKFNIFWSKYADEEGAGKRLSPNGEDMNDEGGYKIKAQQLSFSTKQISSNGNTYTVPYFPSAEELSNLNLALKKTATASRSESGYGATLAVDGDVATRWWAKSTSTQWLKVDLGSRVRVGKVTLRWHSYYAREYEVRVSTDNSNWTRVVDANYGKGGMEEWTFSGRDVRYIMIYCQKPYSSNGYAVYELEAYAP